jgi:hypothetical protein
MRDVPGIRKPHLVVLALAQLGGGERWVDTEDIAVRARELAPEAFSWRKYPEQIDLDGVRVALHDAAKERYGCLVRGSVRIGWSLTAAGVGWARANGSTVLANLGRIPPPKRRDEQRIETKKRALERGRLKRSAAWRLWQAGRRVDARAASAVFRVDSETPPRDIHLKVQRLVDLLGDDPEMGPFVRLMAEMVSDAGPTRTAGGKRRASGGGSRVDG